MRTATELERFLDLPAWVVDTDGCHWRAADWLDQSVSDAAEALVLFPVGDDEKNLAHALLTATTLDDGRRTRSLSVRRMDEIIAENQS